MAYPTIVHIRTYIILEATHSMVYRAERFSLNKILNFPLDYTNSSIRCCYKFIHRSHPQWQWGLTLSLVLMKQKDFCGRCRLRSDCTERAV